MLPNVANVLIKWEQPIKIKTVSQQIQETVNLDGTFTNDVIDSYTEYNVKGVVQPLKATMLNVKPAEQRAWDWQQIHIRNVFKKANVNDIIVFYNVSYKIMFVNEYNQYGYTEYHTVKNFI